MSPLIDTRSIAILRRSRPRCSAFPINHREISGGIKPTIKINTVFNTLLSTCLCLHLLGLFRRDRLRLLRLDPVLGCYLRNKFGVLFVFKTYQ